MLKTFISVEPKSGSERKILELEQAIIIVNAQVDSDLIGIRAHKFFLEMKSCSHS